MATRNENIQSNTRLNRFIQAELSDLLDPLCQSFVVSPYSGQLSPEDDDRAIPRMAVHDPSIEGTMVHQVLDIGIPDPSGNIRECFVTIQWDVLKDQMHCWATDALTGSTHRLDVDTYCFTDNKSLVHGLLRHIRALEYSGTTGPRRLSHKHFLTAMCSCDGVAYLQHKGTDVPLADALNMQSSRLYALTLHLYDTDDYTDDEVPEAMLFAAHDLAYLTSTFPSYEHVSKVFRAGGSLRTVITRLTGKGLFK